MQRFYLFIGIILLTLAVACASGTRRSDTAYVSSRIDRPLQHGSALYRQGCYARALELFREAHERYTAADDLAGIAGSLNSIANVRYQLDDMPGAIGAYAQALEAYRLLGDDAGLVRVLANQSAALVKAGRLDEAARTLDQADTLDAATRLSTLRLKNRALIAMARRDTQTAQSLLNRALDAAGPNEETSKAAAHYTLGRLLADTARPEEAEIHFQQALAADRQMGAYPAVAKDLAALGGCRARMGDHAAAVGFFLRSAKIYALLQDTARTNEITAMLKESADRSGTDIQTSLYWIDEWLAGRTESTLCR